MKNFSGRNLTLMKNFDYKLIKEEVDGKKKYFIRGPFSKAGVINKNQILSNVRNG